MNIWRTFQGLFEIVEKLTCYGIRQCKLSSTMTSFLCVKSYDNTVWPHLSLYWCSFSSFWNSPWFSFILYTWQRLHNSSGAIWSCYAPALYSDNFGADICVYEINPYKRLIISLRNRAVSIQAPRDLRMVSHKGPRPNTERVRRYNVSETLEVAAVIPGADSRIVERRYIFLGIQATLNSAGNEMPDDFLVTHRS